jgi:hypothetical protein
MSWGGAIMNPFFKKAVPSTAVDGWNANTLIVAHIKGQLYNEKIRAATTKTVRAYIKTKSPYLPEESIAFIVESELADIALMVESGALNSGTIVFSKRMPFIDRLIAQQVQATLTKGQLEIPPWSNLR